MARVMTRMTVCTAVLFIGCMDPDEQPVTWSYVYATVIQPNCTSSNCHSELAATAGLQFHYKESAYYYLTGRQCTDEGPEGEANHNHVVPYEPGRSKLMYLLRGEEVRQMPPDVPLPDVEIEFVERWILEGAPCN